MGLSVGIKLGSHEIVSPLGAGGMGEVYRSRYAGQARFGGQGFATKSQHSRSTNGAVGSERQGSEWMVGDPEVIQMGTEWISTEKSASHQEIKHSRDGRLSVQMLRPADFCSLSGVEMI